MAGHPEHGKRIEDHQRECCRKQRTAQVALLVESIGDAGQGQADRGRLDRRELRVGAQQVVGDDPIVGPIQTGRVTQRDGPRVAGDLQRAGL